MKVKKILWLDVQMNLLMFVHFSWVRKWKIETIAKFVAPQWKLNEKKPYWVWFDAKVKPIGTRRYMWGFALWVYYHGQNLSIIKVDEHPLIVVVAIWDISLAKFLEYFDYPLLDKAFKIYLKACMKNTKNNLKLWIFFEKDCPIIYTLAHWENLKVMICNPFKMEEVGWLKAVRSCQQNPSHLRRVEDEIKTQLVMVFVIWI